jgi:nitrite reductase (NO-forming)
MPLPTTAPATSAHRLDVRLDVTHIVQEIADGVKITAWTFGGSVPGPTIRVRQGQTIHFTLANRSNETAKLTPPMPHSMDFHAARVNPVDKYRSIAPGQTLEYEFTPDYAGVFMYHCGTPMILQHVGMGMYGTLIVEPKAGYPTKVDREYVIVQSEFYPNMKAKPDLNGGLPIDLKALTSGSASVFTFNGRAFRHEKEPLKAKPGERVRLFVLNVGPNAISSFHVVGTVFDRVWINGSPENELRGMQAVSLAPANSAIVELVIPEKGKYMMMDHVLMHANAGATGMIDASSEWVANMGAGITRCSELLGLFPGILAWMKVRDQNGRILGKVVATGELEMEIMRGIIFPQFYLVPYVEITSAFGNSLYVARGESALRPLNRLKPRLYLLKSFGSQLDSSQRKAG